MALPVNIDDLITGKIAEWERLEFKEGWNPIKVVQTICAFANDFNNWGGGYIIIGIGEKNLQPTVTPRGLSKQELNTIQKELLNLCHRLQPNYFPIAEPVQVIALCRQLNIVEGPDEFMKPKNVGLLFFNDNPAQFFSGARIDVVEFRDEVGDEFTEKIFTGPIQHQLKSALNYIKNNVIKESVQKVSRAGRSCTVF